jgi:tetratricopeptide (TPR) repeat protein
MLHAAHRCWQRHKEACGFAAHEYLTSTGIVYLESKKPQEARQAFLEALEKMPPPASLPATQASSSLSLSKEPSVSSKTPVSSKESASLKAAGSSQASLLRLQKQREAVFFYLGQASYRLGLYGEAAEALEKASRIGEGMVGYYVLLSCSQREAGRLKDAHQTILAGLRRFASDAPLLREAALLFSRLQHFESAAGMIRARWLVSLKPDISLYLALAETMRAASLYRAILPLLEEARLFFPKDARLLQRLAAAYLQAGYPLAAARHLGEWAQKEPAAAFYASEAYRAAGAHEEALRWSLRIPDPMQRAIQRATLFLATKSYAQAASILRPLWKGGKLSPPLRYRLAYALLHLGEYSEADVILRGLLDSSMASAASSLLALLGRCKASPWLCV